MVEYLLPTYDDLLKHVLQGLVITILDCPFNRTHKVEVDIDDNHSRVELCLIQNVSPEAITVNYLLNKGSLKLIRLLLSVRLKRVFNSLRIAETYVT